MPRRLSAKDRQQRAQDRVASPVFVTDPGDGRVVEPVGGWTGEPGWGADDPLIREWFKIGELLQAEWAELG